MSAMQRAQQWATFARVWHIFDANWQNPLQSAKLIAGYLKGMHKPLYHPLTDCGDHVIVINSKDIAFPGPEWYQRVFFHHTGYAKGASWTLAWELHEKNPTMITTRTVHRAVGSCVQRHNIMARLHVFAGDQVPADFLQRVTNQIRQPRAVPQRLDQIGQQEIDAFPKLFDFPDNYELK